MAKSVKKKKAKAQKKRAIPSGSRSDHKKAFERLLDDAIFGVKKR